MDHLWWYFIIGISLCIIGIYVVGHDINVRADNAEKNLEDMASTSDCTVLKFMTSATKGEWFPDHYIVIAEEREAKLKC